MDQIRPHIWLVCYNFHLPSFMTVAEFFALLSLLLEATSMFLH